MNPIVWICLVKGSPGVQVTRKACGQLLTFQLGEPQAVTADQARELQRHCPGRFAEVDPPGSTPQDAVAAEIVGVDSDVATDGEPEIDPAEQLADESATSQKTDDSAKKPRSRRDRKRGKAADDQQ